MLNVHTRFAAQAQRTPDRLAVARGSERLTYRELDERSNQLARHLVGVGVGSGARVALRLERSPSLLVATLGVWKAGAAYVPVDPTYPEARQAFLVADSGAALVMARDTWPDLAQQPTEPLAWSTDPRALAYVIYTSGSTGTPNGVEVEHASVVNLATWVAEAHAITPDDRATLIASPSFDASVLETWPTLLAGASLHIPDDDTRAVPARLVAWLAEHAITVCFLPTPLLELCLDRLAATSLRAVLTGGDRLTRRPRADVPALFNYYGPTEYTVCTTSARVSPDGAGLPSIGRPIGDTQVYVLDPERRRVPEGEPGELYVGGAGLARGYTSRPELTAARFVRDPFGDGRLYRTGDLVRYGANGELEFLGRVDDQVKIRGYRIEPGEIDAAIRQCAGVLESVTIAREDTPGDTRLVSYVVAAPVASDDPVALAYVAQWQALYQQEYLDEAALPDVEDPEFDTTGWNSSLTGGPIPREQMREWVDTTVAEIARHHPRRILEIGFGTGLLLFPLARLAQRYVATDFSARAVAAVRRHLQTLADLRVKVELADQPAHDLSWLAADVTFDTVVLNSIVQHFPTADYLRDVLEQVIARVEPGGRVFVGDVRDHDRFRAFHVAVERSRGAPDVEARMERDKELLLGPAFFHALRQHLPRISAVEVRPKRGRSVNELTRFRYDVTLHVEAPARQVDPQITGLSGLEAALREAPQRAVLVTGVVDGRGAAEGVDLEDLHALAAASGRSCDVRLGRGSSQVDVLFLEAGAPQVPALTDAFSAEASPPYASDPLRQSTSRQLVHDLREQLARSLPDHLMPSAFVWLPALPRTANGKLDRKALPAPVAPAASTSAPGTATEQVVARIFGQALGLPSVGLQDNFFELGGHSLLAVQVVTTIHDELGVDLPLAALFDAPTAERLAQRIDASGRASTELTALVAEPVTTLPLTPIDVSAHYAKVALGASRNAWHEVQQLDLEPVDLPRLEAAILYAVNLHPIARACILAPTRLRGARWDVAPPMSEPPLDVHVATDDAQLDAIGERVIDAAFALDEPPPVRFSLVRAPGRDRLFVRYNHGAIDGGGLHCLLASVMSRHVGQPDPALRALPFRTEELLAHYPQAPSSLLRNAELAHLVRDLRVPARLEGSGGDPASAAAEVVEVCLSEVDSLALLDAAKRRRSTLDRVFIAGLLRAGVAWNQQRTGSGARIEAWWAVNLRPPRYFHSVVANHWAWSRVRAAGPDDDASAWLARMLDPSSDFLMRGALDFLSLVERIHALGLPDWLCKLLLLVYQRNAPAMAISNTMAFGEPVPSLSRAFGVTGSKHHSRLGSTDRPGLVIGNSPDGIVLRMLYPRSQFDGPGATRFLSHCKASLLELT